MAANTIDYTLNFDTSKLSSTAYEVKSILSTTLGGAATGLTSFGQAAMSGAAMLSQGFTSGYGQVRNFTDPAMAYRSHYGILQAQSQLSQEWAAYRGGPVGVSGFTPPGVGAAEWAEKLDTNYHSRMSRMTSGFIEGASKEVATTLGFGVGGYVGTKAALALGFGGFGTLAGSMLGGFAVAAVAGKFAEESIERGNRMAGEVRQLGGIVTRGRGLSEGVKQQYGMGLSNIADRMGISKPELGDMVAGIKAMGMMPSTDNVKEALGQFEGMAKDIRDIAVGMKTSLGKATQYLKSVEKLGLGRGAGGVFAASGMAAGLGTSLSGLIGHVGMGQQVGMSTGIGAAAGGGIYLQSAFAGARGLSALTGSEQLMAGGAMGLGRTFARGALQNALGGVGQMQLMAMMGQHGAMGLPSTLMGTLGQAASNIFSSGSGTAANILDFTNNRKRMLSQLGATGIRQMQAHAISTEAAMFQKMFPNIDRQAALQHVAMNKGYGEIAARAMAGYISRGYKEIRPSAAVRGLPGVFGSERVSEMARSASYNSAAAMARQDHKNDGVLGLWSRGTEYLGGIWRDYKLGQARGVEAAVQRDLAGHGYAKPDSDVMGVVSRTLRTGRGSLMGSSVEIASGPSRNQVSALFSLSGGQMSGSSVGISQFRKSAYSVAKNISGSMALSGKDRELLDVASRAVSGRIDSGSLDAKSVADAISGGASVLAKGGTVDRFKSGLEGLFKGTAFEQEFEKSGFAGKHGSVLMRLSERFMKSHGHQGFDIGRQLRAVAERGVGAIGLSVDVENENTIAKIAGTASIRDVALKKAQDVRTEENATSAAWLLGTGPVGYLVHGFVTKRSGNEGDRVIKGYVDYYTKPHTGLRAGLNAIVGDTVGNAIWSSDGVRNAYALYRASFGKPTTREVRENVPAALAESRKTNKWLVPQIRNLYQSRSVQEYMKARDRYFYKPGRDAEAQVRKRKDYKSMSSEEKKKAISDAESRIKSHTKNGEARVEDARKRVMDEVVKATKSTDIARNFLDYVDAHGKKISDKVRKFSDIAAAKNKSHRRRRRRGSRVALQSGAQSFQSQVAMSIKQTGHTLHQVQIAMKALEGRVIKLGNGK